MNVFIKISYCVIIIQNKKEINKIAFFFVYIYHVYTRNLFFEPKSKIPEVPSGKKMSRFVVHQKRQIQI